MTTMLPSGPVTDAARSSAASTFACGTWAWIWLRSRAVMFALM